MHKKNAEYELLKKKLSEQEKQLLKLRQREKDYLERIKMLRYQIDKLDHANAIFSEVNEGLIAMFMVFDHELTPVFISQSILKLIGCSLEELKNKKIYEYIHSEDIDDLLDSVKSKIKNNTSVRTGNIRMKLETNGYVNFKSEIYVVGEKNKNPDYIFVQLSISKEQDEQVQPTEMISAFRNEHLFFISPSIEKILGYKPKAFIKHDYFDLFHPEEKDILLRIIKNRIKYHVTTGFTYIYRLRHKKGTYKWLESNVVSKKIEPTGIKTIIYTRDISAHMVESLFLKSTNKKLHAFKLIRKIITDASNETDFLRKSVGIICQAIGYQLVLIGFKEDTLEKKVRIVAYEGFSKEYIKNLKITWGDDKYGTGPGGAAIRTGEVQVMKISDEQFHPWRKLAKNQNFKEVCAVPLIIQKNVIGAIGFYSSEENTFTINEIGFLLEVSEDISRGIQLIRNERIRQIAEEDLRKSEEKYRSFFNNAPLGIFRSTPDGRFIEANNTMARMLGYDTPEEVVENVRDIANQVYVEPGKRQKIVDYSKKSSFIHHYENVYKRLDGSHFTANLYLRVVKNENGEPAYLEGMVEDITYRKNADKTIREKEERLTKLNTILNEAEKISGIGSFEWDIKEDVLIFSKGWQEIHGFYQNRVSFNKIKQLAHPDDLPFIIEAIEKALKGETDYEIEHRVLRNNVIRYIKARSKVIYNSKGEAIKMYGSIQDITEQKIAEQALRESNEKYKFLTEATSELICLHDSDGNYQYVSPSVNTMLGYEVNELEGTDPYNLFHPSDRERIKKDSHQMALNGKPIDGIEYRIRKKDGSYIWFDTYTDIILDDQGSVKHLISRSRDITERKMYEIALKKSEEKLKMALDIAVADTWEMNLETNEIIYSENWINRLGYTIQELSFNVESISKIFNEKDIQASWEKLYAHLEGKTSFYESEARIRKKNAGWVWILSRGKVVQWDKNNKPTRLLGVNVDITERKNAEKALKLSEERLKQAEKSGRLGHFEMDVKTGQAMWSDELYRIFGYGVNEIQPDFDNFRILIHPDDREKVHNLFYDSTNEHNDYDLEFRIIFKDGSTRYVHSKGQLRYDENDEPVSMFGTLQDVTEQSLAKKALRESEEKYRKLITGMNDGVVLLDHESRIVSSNPAAEKILGYNHEELLGTKSTSDKWATIHEDGSPFPAETHPATITLKTGKPMHNVIMGIKKSSGNVSWISINSEPFFLADAQKIFAMVTFTDITDLINTEQQLRELNATKDRFFSIIAHDLLNPFNAILGFSKLLCQHVDKRRVEKIQEYSNMIYQSSQQGYALLNNLLEWSRSQSGRIDFKPTSLNIGMLVSEVFELLHFVANKKNISLEYHSEEEVHIEADPNMLLTILRNLVSNAVKYSYKDGKVKVAVSRKGSGYEFIVSDDGVGMKKETLDNLFRIDTHISSRGTENEKGTGLGLIICHDFVQRHGGKIWAESKPCKGCRIAFTIPGKRDAHADVIYK